MADHMHWAALFLSAFVAFICDCKPLDGYKFPVYTTELCPRNQTEWMERSSAINCTESNGYLCLPSEDLNELLEFCYFEYQIPIAKGLCMFLRKRDSFIDAYNCRNFVEGCPNSTYRIYEVNKYRSCVSIGNSCFLAEPACIRTASIEETNNTMHKFIPFQERNDGVWIFWTFLGVAIGALIIVPVNMFYRKMKRKDGKHEKRTAVEEVPLVGNNEHIKATEENEVVKKEHMDKERDMDEINKEESEKDKKKETKEAERNKEASIVNDVHKKEFKRGSRRPTTMEFSTFREENKQPENEKDKYEYFWEKESVFSQWYPSKFVVDGVEYSYAEQYMMQQKAILMNDMETADIIMALDKLNEMKDYGRCVKNFSQTLWDQHCTRIVEKGNIAKFSQNDDLKMTLFSTYPKTLVEASPYDKVWGIGLRQNDRRAWNKSTWLGKNLLGEILTRVRDKLREEM